MLFWHQVYIIFSDFNEQEYFISQLKQEKQELKDGEHACTVYSSQTITVAFST